MRLVVFVSDDDQVSREDDDVDDERMIEVNSTLKHCGKDEQVETQG